MPPRFPRFADGPGSGRFGRTCLLGLILLVLATASPAAIGQESGATPIAVSTPTVTGAYTVTIAQPDLPPNLPNGAVLLGLWTITFNADGTFALSRQDTGVVVSGTYDTAGVTLTLNDWNGLVGCGAPGGEAGPATYAWRKVDAGLSLTPISDTCADRRLLLSTRQFGAFSACAVVPLATGRGSGALAPGVTPVAAGVTAQEGLPIGESTDDAIDALLAQATACWATGDPARFLPLHSERVISELAAIAPLPDLANSLRTVMTVPVAFQRIGDVTMIDPMRAWAYVEVTLGGEPVPQRIDFVLEDGVWLFDTFFLFGPSPAAPGPP